MSEGTFEGGIKGVSDFVFGKEWNLSRVSEGDFEDEIEKMSYFGFEQ